MPKNFSDFSHRRSRAKHGSRQAVAKKVGSLELGVQVRAVECSANDRGQCRGTSKASAWRFRANEYSACSAGRAISTQVGSQGFAYIRREGHPVVKQPLAPNEDFAGSPVDVL
jgi:hypothetical protein